MLWRAVRAAPTRCGGWFLERVRATVLTVVRMRAALLVAALTLCAGCQGPDVGQSCTIAGLDPQQPVAADWLVSGAVACDNLVCIGSPPSPAGSKVKNNPYCSKACVSDRDCYHSETGLSCRQVVLDPDFLAQLDDDTRRKYLGDVAFSSYCAIPLP